MISEMCNQRKENERLGWEIMTSETISNNGNTHINTGNGIWRRYGIETCRKMLRCHFLYELVELYGDDWSWWRHSIFNRKSTFHHQSSRFILLHSIIPACFQPFQHPIPPKGSTQTHLQLKQTEFWKGMVSLSIDPHFLEEEGSRSIHKRSLPGILRLPRITDGLFLRSTYERRFDLPDSDSTDAFFATAFQFAQLACGRI